MANEYISEVLSFSYTQSWWSIKKEERASKLSQLSSKLKSWSISANAAKAESYDSLRGDSDILFWLMCRDPKMIIEAKLLIEEQLSGYATVKAGFLSAYQQSREKPNAEGKDYFVAYPMSKRPDWYLLDKDESKRIVADHVKIAMNSSHNGGINSYTTKSFGIADYEFVVIYEIPDIFEWVKVTEELRSAEARKWITNEAPILTGIKMGI
ncbi:MAG: chlorite dismutase family protein [Methanothrix sp.]